MTARQITEDEFSHLLDSFRRSAFRLETRDTYALDYEAEDFRRFLAGDPEPPPRVDWWRPWLDQIEEMAAEGRRVARVRLIAEPPSDYQRWELWAAPWHMAAGEDIRYMPHSLAAKLGLPGGIDWWLLDDERLILMWFDTQGRIAGKVLVADPQIIALHCEWRDLAVRNAAPVEVIAA